MPAHASVPRCSPRVVPESRYGYLAARQEGNAPVPGTMEPMTRPPALRPGARVALVAPAGPVTPEGIERAVQRVRRWGWEPVLGTHAAGRFRYLSGTDEQRAADLNQAFRSPEVDAIWLLRGGYGTMRILERLDWAALRERPRPVIGFSDNTALHLAIRRLGLVSFHGPHAAAEAIPPFAARALRRALSNGVPPGPLPFPEAAEAPRAETVIPGVAEGPLLGGNLSLLAATLGTRYSVSGEGWLLFLEEVGEPVYRIDRLLSQLLLAGVFARAAGVVIGALSECPDRDEAHVPTTVEVVRDRLGALRVPVAVGFPFGHVPHSWTLPLGVRARLDSTAGTLALLEPAVASLPR
jgi:muramoyltetrapeptide carboxypeptidase